jgi:methionine-rich copper-binding protein CopC
VPAVWPVLACLLGAMVMLAVTAAPAAAHDALVSSAPADGARVAHAPTRIVLTFDQPALALGTAVVVTSSAGQQIQAGAPRLVDNTVTQPLQPGAPAGPYTVLWRVTSADGHPISGRFTFQATAASTERADGPSTLPPAPDAPVQDPAGTGGGVLWLGLLAGLAAVAVVLVLLRRATERRAP